MSQKQSLTFKIADADWEIEAIHRLNYATFVEEIPQHRHNAAARLVDKFHHENAYLICVRDEQLLGMMAVRDKRPFALDQKLANLDSYLPPHDGVCELRLLATAKHQRSPRIFAGIIRLFAQYAAEQGYDLSLISVATPQQRLYRAIGFEPFGPLMGAKDTQCQPMYLSMRNYQARFHDRFHTSIASAPWMPAYDGAAPNSPNHASTVTADARPFNLLPGPVAISETVHAAWCAPAISHRSAIFMADFAAIKDTLCQLVNAQHVEIFTGSGTLANDVIGAHLATLPGQGLVLNNGEFGQRLIDHATRWRLDFQIAEAEWGSVLELEGVADMLGANPTITWLWTVHCETSSGVLNDIDALQKLCQRHNVRLCLDCTSSVGSVPVDLSNAYLASSVSGKAIGSYPGLSMVFYNAPVPARPDAIPRYLDIGYYAQCKGVPFTMPSNALYALRAAVGRLDPDYFAEIAELSAWLHAQLVAHGFTLIGQSETMSPAVITIELPPSVDSVTVGQQLEDAGCLLNYRSGYLVARNWMQIYLVGGMWNRAKLTPFVRLLCDTLHQVEASRAKVTV